ncbi:DUF2256 domain-containing protein [Bradyrhizobium sp. 17]|nr:DUF2256 domain-containing protein [Bradyrhizobium sp. 17]
MSVRGGTDSDSHDRTFVEHNGCRRPFSWRKKWAEDWDQVKTCSDRCGGELRLKGPATNKGLAQRSVRAPSVQGRCGHAH